jgi:hypothetical protein
MAADILETVGEVTLLFGGDTCPVGRGAAAVQLGPDVFWPEIAALFREHDLTVVNLETPLVATETAPSSKCGPTLAGTTRFAGFLGASGITAVTLANNHVMDMGAEGLESTLRALDEAGVLSTGAGQTLAAAQKPLLLPTPAGTIGLISVAEGEFSAASARAGGAAPLSEATVAAGLQQLSPQCTLSIVIYHGGNEGRHLPSPEMVRRCRAFVDLGAAAVVCHHAHAVSGCEEYRGGVIAYGLGNLMFDWPRASSASWCTGALLSLRVRAGRVISWRLLGTEQDMAVPVVRVIRDRDSFEAEVTERSAIISDSVELGTEFVRFCHSSRESYLTRLLGLNRIERPLVRWGINPRWRLRRGALLSLLNTLECESHREAAAEVLREELGLSKERQLDADTGLEH